MTQIKTIIIVLAFTAFSPNFLKAQEAISASGNHISGSNGSLSYSIGQLVYTTNPGSNGSVVQGVQQGYEITKLTGIDKAENISLQYRAYPNPTTDFLTLEIENYETLNLKYMLFDINGRVLENGNVRKNQTSISLEKYTSAIYFLKIFENKEVVTSFKIIKN